MYLGRTLKRATLPVILLSSLLGTFYIYKTNHASLTKGYLEVLATEGPSQQSEERDLNLPNGVLSFRVRKIGSSNHTLMMKSNVDTSFLQKFAPQYDTRTGTCQKKSRPNIHLAFMEDNIMTIPLCEEKCLGVEGSSHFALAKGRECSCLNAYGSEPVQKYTECDTPCPGNPETFCGGAKAHESVFKIDVDNAQRNGDVKTPIVKYSPWTSINMEPGYSESAVRRRYSGCDSIDYNTVTECEAAIETDSVVVQKHLKGVGSKFIGCFTDLAFHENATFKVAFHSTSKRLISSSTASKCVKFCMDRSALYAVVMKTGCFCGNSLGWAQPIDGCQYFLGAAVFSTSHIGKTIRLTFEKEIDKAKVAIIAHYRGGSTFSLEMFDSYPGALAIYEPDYVLGDKWPGVATYWTEEERSHVFLNQILPYWFDCKQDLLPAFFTRLHIPVPSRSGIEPFKYCRQMAPKPENQLCLNFLKEECLSSPLVVFKTVRILAPMALEHAILQRPDVHFLYVSRDPRGQMASRMRQFRWWSENPVARLNDLCTEMIKLEPIFNRNKYKNAHITFYEKQAVDTADSVQKVYNEIGLSLPKIVEDRMLYITGKADKVNEREANFAFGVVRSDASKHINDWTKSSHFIKDVLIAEKAAPCAQLFKVYEENYIPYVIMRQ